jgi:membrane-associated phospholipid phosphatase
MLWYLIYLLIGTAPALAQYIVDEHEPWKVIFVMLLWPWVLLVCLSLIIIKAADRS